MTHTHFLRIKKLTGKNIIQVAAKHNCRELAGEIGVTAESYIDPKRIRHNIILRGADTAAGIAGAAQSLMDDAKVKPLRKDAVRALEIIFSLQAESTIAYRPYFEDATRWAENYFNVPAISSIIHLDEAAPHCHVILLPLINGRMVGSDLMGGRSKIVAHQSDFHDKVGKCYGLARMTISKPPNASIRREALELAFNALEANSGLNSAIIRVLIEPHQANPAPLLAALNLAMPKPEAKGTFAGIMTKKVKREKPIGFSKHHIKKPIGFDIDPSEKHQTLCSVGFQLSDTVLLPESEPIQSTDLSIHPEDIAPRTIENEPAQEIYQRESDSDQSAESWDEIRGEFIKRPAKASMKPAIRKAVDNSLRSIGKTRNTPRPTYHFRN
ncbi:MAG: plasmid recombination protein [Burkholderiaceae bacterium]|nr:plasmid recombination protein [Burkholderiaceae bacterium]